MENKNQLLDVLFSFLITKFFNSMAYLWLQWRHQYLISFSLVVNQRLNPFEIPLDDKFQKFLLINVIYSWFLQLLAVTRKMLSFRLRVTFATMLYLFIRKQLESIIEKEKNSITAVI